MKKFLAVFLTSLLLMLSGCDLVPTRADYDQQPVSDLDTDDVLNTYKLNVGDEIQVNVWKNEELSVQVPIRPDGKIAMPLIGDVPAAGKEPEALATLIRVRLLKYIKSPNVTVIPVGIEGQKYKTAIRITGAVKNSMSLEYRLGMTILDAVLEAGSVTIYADSNNARLHRKGSEGTQSIRIRLRDILEKGDMTTNLVLSPGDVITVPERRF
ncbi:MAG: XrtA/PEP-CTERM system exopolysaccharide export protein [Gammaproteobacteria bacterium]